MITRSANKVVIYKNALSLIVLAVSIASYSPKIQFTQAAKEQHQLTDDEMKKLQFYTSIDVVLQRNQMDNSGKETDDGELVITSGSSLDQVIIPAGTTESLLYHRAQMRC